MAPAAVTNKSPITIIPCSSSPRSGRHLSLHLRSPPLPTPLLLIATARPPRLSHPLRRRRHRLSRAAAAEASTAPVDRDVGIIELIRAFLPGGSWWKLDGGGGGDDAKAGAEGERGRGKAVTVMYALRRMWALVAEDRWIIVVAFVSLIFAALSDISIPHFLAASIFSAQNGEKAIFYRCTRLLVLLCFTSGIFGGLRGCCFGIANMTLVKRMREMLYSALVFQDVSFFDEETVGDLTSRLGADCQQVSRVIGNDLNMILRYAVQGTGALIYLFILSWPLALTTLFICTVLSTILFFYGRSLSQWEEMKPQGPQKCNFFLGGGIKVGEFPLGFGSTTVGWLM